LQFGRSVVLPALVPRVHDPVVRRIHVDSEMMVVAPADQKSEGQKDYAADSNHGRRLSRLGLSANLIGALSKHWHQLQGQTGNQPPLQAEVYSVMMLQVGFAGAVQKDWEKG